MIAVRDTMKRFDDFIIPPLLAGKTFLDLGANVGAVAFEAAKRGAKVTGVEFRDDRVSLCNVIAESFGLRAKFYQADFNAPPEIEDPVWYVPHDIVLCCSVDEYINDVPRFYVMLRELTKETLYLECNVQRGQDVQDTLDLLRRAGFSKVGYLGSGHSGGISRKRKIYRATP